MRTVLILSAAWILLALLPSCSGIGSSEADASAKRSGSSTIVLHQAGDEPGWAEPNFDDAEWQTITPPVTPDVRGVQWVRIHFQLIERSPPASPLCVALSAAAAREVFWDGVPIGSTGSVAQGADAESAGSIDSLHPIPESSSQEGPHVLALRLSNHASPARVRGLLLQADVGDLRHLAENRLRQIGWPLVFLGSFVLVAIYYMALYGADRRRRAFLLTSLLCATVAALLVAESWRWTFGYTYDLHGLRLYAVECLTCAVTALLVATLAEQFKLPRGGWAAAAVLALSIIVIAASATHEAGTYLAFTVGLGVSLSVAGWAAWKKRTGARFALPGVALCLGALIASGHNFMDLAFFPAFAMLVAGILVSLGIQTRAAALAHEATLASNARLEAQLLKKHLQPHFLANTLTSILEWVETEPARGARAVEALAEELHMLTRVSDRPLIPMSEELRLCRAHLEIMGHRRGVSFSLEEDRVDLNALIPPAVIHTLVENAITHSAYEGGAISLRLTEQSVNDGGTQRRQLRFEAPLGVEGAARGPERGGLLYVRSRLEECAPGDWTLTAGAEPQETALDRASWVTLIGLPMTLTEAPPRP